MSKPTVTSALEVYLADLLADAPKRSVSSTSETTPSQQKIDTEKLVLPRLRVKKPKLNKANKRSFEGREAVSAELRQAGVDAAARGNLPAFSGPELRLRSASSAPTSASPVVEQALKYSEPTIVKVSTGDREQQSVLEDEKRLQLQEMLSRRTNESLQVPPEPIMKTTEISVSETTPQPIQGMRVSPCEQRLLKWSDNGRPFWAEGSFEILLFEVSGLSLAVPLVALGQIIPLTDKLTVLQGQSEWFMGLLPSGLGDIRTVNTALFVMPERYDCNFLESAKYVVTIDGMPWGLAVDGVKQPIKLHPDDVKWRTQRTQRPWLAGTVKSHMCALIDIPQMAELLKHADKNHLPIKKINAET